MKCKKCGKSRTLMTDYCEHCRANLNLKENTVDKMIYDCPIDSCENISTVPGLLCTEHRIEETKKLNKTKRRKQ